MENDRGLNRFVHHLRHRNSHFCKLYHLSILFIPENVLLKIRLISIELYVRGQQQIIDICGIITVRLFAYEVHDRVIYFIIYSDGYRGEAPDYVMSRSDTRVINFFIFRLF